VRGPYYDLSLDEQAYLKDLSQEEFQALLVVQRLVAEYKPMLAVELGTFRGGGAAMIALAMPEGGRVITIDNKRYNYPDSQVGANLKHKDIARLGLDSKVTRAIGQSEECDTLIREITDDMVDFCYIDAWHTYESCKNDYLAISKVLAKEHLVVFDDVNLGQRTNANGLGTARGPGDAVFAFIPELFPKYHYMEYYNAYNGVMACWAQKSDA